MSAEDFFNSFSTTPIFSLTGLATLFSGLLAGILFGVAYRRVLKYFSKTTPTISAVKNIGSPDRLLRVGMGITCLILSIFTWSPLLMIAAGFCFYEAAAKWCGFYALIGRNTCSLP